MYESEFERVVCVCVCVCVCTDACSNISKSVIHDVSAFLSY